MRTTAILSISLATIALCLGACSKESSKKQPKLRSRAGEVFTKPQTGGSNTPQGRERSLQKPVGTPPRTGSSDLQKPGDPTISSHQHKSRIGLPCGPDISPCHSKLLGILDPNDTDADLLDLSQYEGITYTLSDKAENLKANTNTSGILAEGTFPVALSNLDLKVIYIVPQKTDVDASTAYDNSKILEIPLNMDFDDQLIAEVKKAKASEHILFLTSFDALTNDPNMKTLLRTKLDGVRSQKDYVVGAISDQEDLVKGEQAFLNSFIAQLNYRIDTGSRLKDFDIEVQIKKAADQEFETLIQDDEYEAEALANPGRIEIRILKPLQVFKGVALANSENKSSYQIRVVVTPK